MKATTQKVILDHTKRKNVSVRDYLSLLSEHEYPYLSIYTDDYNYTEVRYEIETKNGKEYDIIIDSLYRPRYSDTPEGILEWLDELIISWGESILFLNQNLK